MVTKKTFIKRDNIVVMFKQIGGLREATILENCGCTYKENTKMFSSAEDGNAFYKLYIEDGFVKATEEDYDKIVRGY